MSGFVDTLLTLSKTVSAALTGPVVPAVIGIAQDVVQLIDKAKDVVDSDDVPALEAMLADLEPKVMAHADATEATLRGEG